MRRPVRSGLPPQPASPSPLSLHVRFRSKTEGGWERYTLQAEPRSLYLMAGESRHVWEHSVPPVDAKRYSVKFRTVAGEVNRASR
jgi:alkylated DNA repair dioxygenase AlkB